MKRFLKTAAVALTASLASLTGAQAQGIDDPGRADYFAGLEGRTVAFVPLGMGFDLTEGWAAIMRRQAEELGMTFVLRDANWSSDTGAQAITSLISEQPDVMVVHNPDVQSYARLLRRAEQAGIKVIQINMRSAYQSEAYVGADWVGIGEESARAAVAQCGEGTSGKIQIVQGVLTAAASAYTIQGVMNVLNEHPEIEVVSSQAGNWDATTAHNITATVLQQHPDLCASIGFWDVMDTGTAAALREAGREDVYLITSGGGAQMACDNVASGLFDYVVSYDVPQQGSDLNLLIRAMIQQGSDAGDNQVQIYSTTTTITQETLREGMCWNLEDLR